MKGNIIERSKRVWRLRWDEGPDPGTGKRKQGTKTIRGNRRDAETELRRILHSLETGSYVKPSKYTLGQHLEQWLVSYVRPNLAPKTAEGYEHIVRRHLIPAIGVSGHPKGARAGQVKKGHLR